MVRYRPDLAVVINAELQRQAQSSTTPPRRAPVRVDTERQPPDAHLGKPTPRNEATYETTIRATSGGGSATRADTNTATSASVTNAVSESLQDLLGIAEDPLVAADPVSFLQSLGIAALATMRNPAAVMNAGMRFTVGAAGALQGAAGCLRG